MINEFKSYHGSAFADLIDDSSVPIKISRPDQDNNAFYVLDDNIALYVKHSTKRLTPWRFTFHTDHMNDLIEILNSIIIKGIHELLGVICRAVVDDYQFPILKRLLNYTSDASRQKRSSIVGWKNNGKEWHIHVGYPKIVHFK